MKILGAALLAAVPVIVLCNMIYSQNKHLQALKEFNRTICFVRDEMRYSNREKSEIFSQLAHRGIKNKAILYLCGLNGGRAELCYEKFEHCGFTKQELSLLNDFYSAVGVSGLHEQLNMCENYAKALQITEKETAEKIKEKRRMDIGLLLSISAVIFLMFC